MGLKKKSILILFVTSLHTYLNAVAKREALSTTIGGIASKNLEFLNIDKKTFPPILQNMGITDYVLTCPTETKYLTMRKILTSSMTKVYILSV